MLTLYNDRQLAEHMGQQARQRYLELFTAEKMSAAYLEIYQQLLAKRTPAT
jgi:rhamnosyl/mannosyltransferase